MPRIIPPGQQITVESVLTDYGREADFIQPFVLHAAGYRKGIDFALRGRQVFPFPTEVDLGWFDRVGTREVAPSEVARREKIRVVGVVCADKRVGVSATSQGTLDIRTKTLDVGTPIDTFADVTFRDAALTSKQRIWIRGMASRGLVVEPAKLRFGLIVAGDPPVTKTAIVRSSDGRPFELKTSGPEDDSVSVELIPGTPTEVRVAVTIHPVSPEAIQRNILLTTPDARRGVTLSCVGLVE